MGARCELGYNPADSRTFPGLHAHRRLAGRMRIDRIGIWAVNIALGVACCWLVATVVNGAVSAALVDDTPPPVAGDRGTEPTERSWEDRRVILERNLFNASVLAPTEPVAPVAEEDLEETKLPLALLGTAATGDPDLSWAAVEDREERVHLVVKVGDVLKDRAHVVRIERGRLVLQNGPRREELLLQEDERGGSRVASRRSVRPARPARASRTAEELRERVRRLSDSRFEVDREDVQETVRNPAELFSQARILPKYEEGQMVGVQLNSVKEGSLFEDIGIQSGDTITQLNGISIDSPEQSAALLRELAEADEFEVDVVGADGEVRSLSFIPQ